MITGDRRVPVHILPVSAPLLEAAARRPFADNAVVPPAQANGLEARFHRRLKDALRATQFLYQPRRCLPGPVPIAAPEAPSPTFLADLCTRGRYWLGELFTSEKGRYRVPLLGLELLILT